MTAEDRGSGWPVVVRRLSAVVVAGAVVLLGQSP
ncbi:hypothetical protein CLV30_1161, partial [Haloactinopolyspora alba]